MKDPFQQSFKRYDVKDEPTESGKDGYVGLLASLLTAIVAIVGFLVVALRTGVLK